MTESESLQRAIHEAVALVPYDSQWPALFITERDRLMSLFPSQLLEVQHLVLEANRALSEESIQGEEAIREPIIIAEQ